MAVRDLSELTMEKAKRAYADLPESTKESHRKANMRYSQKMEKQVKINLHKENDADIIAALETCGNVQGYIKALIRADQAAKKQ